MMIYCVCELCKKAVMEDPKTVIAGDIPGYVKCRACIMKNQPARKEPMTVVTSSVVNGVRHYKTYRGIGTFIVNMNNPAILTGISTKERTQSFSIDYRPVDDKLIKAGLKKSYKKRKGLSLKLRKALK